MILDYFPARLSDAVTHGRASAWPYDKYPDTERLTAHTAVTLLDADGPGVVTCIHATHFVGRGGGLVFEPEAVRELQLRVYYDHASQPAIELPWHDFLFDAEGKSDFFSLNGVSKVHRANNFRLPMPFSSHIRIVLENPTDRDLIGYADVQWDSLPQFPKDLGYLYVERRGGTLTLPDAETELCSIRGRGRIAGHWLLLSADDPICQNGELLCEANNEFYLDGGDAPALEYLGTEDFYGFSWGFEQPECDGTCAILRKEATPNGGAVIGLARMRTTDAISFRSGCRYVFTYRHEINPALPGLNPNVRRAVEQGGVHAAFESCVYYYK